MRLIVMGQQAFGKDVLAKLLETGTDEVVAVYCEPDKEGKPVDPIKEFALEQGLPVEQPADFKDQAVLDTLASFDADLMVMAFVNIFGYVDEWTQEQYAGAGEESCEGLYGGSCILPLPEIKNRFSATWATPWDVSVNLNWRYLDEVEQSGAAAGSGIDIDSQNYIDLAVRWQVTDYASLRLGMNNVMDEEPPFVAQGATARENGNTYPGIYDPLGQYLFAGFTVQF